MSIAFTCTCGKKLQAPDEFAGRRMKCKGCGTVLPIPDRAAKAVKSPAKRSPQKGVTPPSAPPKPTSAPPKKAAAAATKKAAHQAESPATSLKKAAPPQTTPLVAAPPALPLAEPNPWGDRTLEQRSVPWQHGDERREGAREAARGGPGALLNLLAILLVAAVAGAGWMFWPGR